MKKMTAIRNRRYSFTLLEICIAIVLICLCSVWTGVKMHQALERKRFVSDLERLQARGRMCSQLARARESDWQGVLKKNSKGWEFETTSLEMPQTLERLVLGQFDFSWEGSPIQSLHFDFYSSGQIAPQGTFVVASKKNPSLRQTLQFPEWLMQPH